jgi:(Z)-2-((N-methylformamido)methylene)-5-hydroxybutyrolactone dehydrogenase
VRLTVSAVEGARLPYYADGQWRQSAAGGYLPSFDPTTGEPWYEATDCDGIDVEVAVDAARAALHHPGWRSMTQTERGKMLLRLADLVADHADALGELECRDTGKLLRETNALASALPETLRYWAGMADKVQGETIPINKPNTFNYTRREPIGVIAAVVPWNSPLYILAETLGPSLAIGNTVIAKPSEHTAVSALALAELVEAAGFPPGVFNVVTGYGHTAGEALTRHPGVDKVTFTGGTATGRKVAEAAASHLASCDLELGGKSPNVVFDDANLDQAAAGVVAGIFAASGQTCVAGSRTFLQERIYDEVLDRLVDRAHSIRVGHPADSQTQLGPLALKQQLDKIIRYVAIGREEGAKLAAGGSRPTDDGLDRGWYFQPTIFTAVDNGMRIAREEIFGPVASVMKFRNEKELIEMANDTEYGLAAGIWTADIDRAFRFANEVHAGTVWINTYRAVAPMTPFGGFKHSGYGKVRGTEAIREFTRTKSVLIDYSGETQDPFVLRT